MCTLEPWIKGILKPYYRSCKKEKSEKNTQCFSRSPIFSPCFLAPVLARVRVCVRASPANRLRVCLWIFHPERSACISTVEGLLSHSRRSAAPDCGKVSAGSALQGAARAPPLPRFPLARDLVWGHGLHLVAVDPFNHGTVLRFLSFTTLMF